MDRKGRILAEDRAAFRVELDFDVIRGDWVREAAGSFARGRHRERWSELSDDAKAVIIARYEQALAAHRERALDLLAGELRMDRVDLDTRLGAITRRVESLREHLAQTRARQVVDDAAKRGKAVDFDEEVARQRRQPIAQEVSAHVIAEGVSDSTGFSLMRLADEQGPVGLVDDLPVQAGLDAAPLVPGLRVVDAGERVYPLETMSVRLSRRTLPSPVRADDDVDILVTGVACHILGWVGGPPQREDVDRRAAQLAAAPHVRNLAVVSLSAGTSVDRGAYREGDVVGRGGVEAAQESVLRGLRGVRFRRVDTGEERIVEAVRGRDVRLTIDASLQARVQAAMAPELGLAVAQEWHRSPGENDESDATPGVGDQLNGAAVVIEVATGEILAAVSTPTFTREQLRARPKEVFGDPIGLAYLNRALAAEYPPGSIVKALVVAEAMTDGRLKPGGRIACNGHFLENRQDILRCWIYRPRFGMSTHSVRLGHDPDSREALAVSCNIFFYTLGQRLGSQGCAALYARMGVGRGFGLGAGAETPGHISPQIDPGAALQLAIGQGPVAWSPLHAANAYATLARAGVALSPSLILEPRTAPEPVESGLDPRSVEAALDGLWDSVNEPIGTGHHLTINGRNEPHFNIPGVDVWGKTGTATAPDLKVDPDGDGPEPPRVAREGDHSWFVVLAGPSGQGPRFAIAVIMEYAGSGGRVSGPIANQIIHALVAEGYLQPSRRAGAMP